MQTISDKATKTFGARTKTGRRLPGQPLSVAGRVLFSDLLFSLKARGLLGTCMSAPDVISPSRPSNLDGTRISDYLPFSAAR